jgi:O-acetyl-ADP-ribose deacetylase (regulator of RNase III)
MTLKHTKGDLLQLARQGHFDVVVHGCNCFCRMGAGIAKQIRQQYPIAWEEDQKTQPGDIMKLGQFTTVDTGEFLIVNAYTQFDITKQGENVFEYSSFEVILRKLAFIYPNKRFGLPYIGMGLANGDKVRIMNCIENFATKVNVTLVEFSK